MANTMRWKYGETNPVVLPVASATVIEIGDLLYLDTDDAKPASSQADVGSEPSNQEAFADKFLGVAMQRSRDGDTSPIRVAATGVFEYDCPSGTFELGELIGVDETGGTTLMDQQVDAVTQSRYAIARCAKREPSATTSVYVDIRSTIMTGGVEGGSPSGV